MRTLGGKTGRVPGNTAGTWGRRRGPDHRPPARPAWWCGADGSPYGAAFALRRAAGITERWWAGVAV